jgi:uncharacterized protein
MTLDDKFSKLKKTLKGLDSVLIAFSGGVDSTFLLKAASMSGLSRILAVTGVSQSVPAGELSFSRKISSEINVEHRFIDTEELKDSNYSSNPPDRCYYCKKELFGRLKKIARSEGYPFILDGTNADDVSDWRPGRRAAEETGVRSPLYEVELGKDEIRELSRTLNLPTWSKPATPCLSSRFPYGEPITAKALDRVNQAETFLKSLGFRELRVRHHNHIARIEIHPDEFSRLLKESAREKVIAYLKSIGYRIITLDLEGFRSGSSNEALPD